MPNYLYAPPCLSFDTCACYHLVLLILLLLHAMVPQGPDDTTSKECSLFLNGLFTTIPPTKPSNKAKTLSMLFQFQHMTLMTNWSLPSNSIALNYVGHLLRSTSTSPTWALQQKTPSLLTSIPFASSNLSPVLWPHQRDASPKPSSICECNQNRIQKQTCTLPHSSFSHSNA